jgi:nucleoside-diphosphate-sugar epimerase
MKVIVTGGAGFLGQLLVRAIAARGALTDSAGATREVTQIIAVDPGQHSRLFVDDRVEYVAGDISTPHFLEHVMGKDTDAVFHLAAVVSGAAEADFDLGLRVNLDGTRWLLEACRVQKTRPSVLFASSVAVFGGALPAVVTDATAPAPQSSYGTQKLLGELLVHDYSRKGFIDGRAVRLPTIVVRAGKPNAAASSFASGIIREPLAGVPAVCPVALDTPMWLAPPASAVQALVHAHEVARAAWDAGGGGALNLPGLTVQVGEMLAALRDVAGAQVADRVTVQPDERIEAIVRTWPARFATDRAEALGFAAVPPFGEIVRAYAAEHAAASL